MKYSFEMPSPEYETLLKALYSSVVHAATQAASVRVRHGRTSVLHRSIQAEIEQLNRVISTLEKAKDSATPERAIQRTDIVARNFPDDMPMVYGRPRNDPRDARTGTKRMPRK